MHCFNFEKEDKEKYFKMKIELYVHIRLNNLIADYSVAQNNLYVTS
jgi:hypothetical protein